MARQSKGITLPIIYKADLGGLKKAETGLQKFGRMAGQIGAAAAAALGAVVVGGVRMATELETSFAKIEGLVGVTGEELDKLREAAKRLGPETGNSAQEAADALFVLTSAGLRGTDAVDALEAALKASTAGLGETEDIARAVSGALNAYADSNLDAARATDVIVATARAGNFETSQFAASIGRVLPFAQQAGASLEDMGGAVALLTRTNGDAAQSVTQVAALFRAFVVPTEQAKKALDRVGLSAQDMRDAIAREGLPRALAMLDEKLGGNREELGRLLGSSEASSAAFQILNADAETIAATFGEVAQSAGITDEAFGVMEDTVGFRAAQAFETLKGIMLEIGDAVLPMVADLLEDLGPVLSDMASAAKAFVDTRLAPFIAELQADPEFQTFISTVKDIVKEMAGPAGQVATALGEIARALAPVLKGALEETLPLIGDFATTVGNIAASLAILFPMLQSGEEGVDGFADAWYRSIPLIGAWLGEDGIMATLADATSGMRERLEEEAENIELFWRRMGEAIQKFFEDPLAAIQGTLETFAEVFRNAFRILFGITDEELNKQNERVGETGPQLYATANGVMLQMLQGFIESFVPIAEWFATLPETIRGFFGEPGELLRPTGEGIMGGLLGGLRAAWGAVARWVREKVSWIISTFKSALKIGSPSKVFFEFGENIVDGLRLGLDAKAPAIDGAMGNVMSPIASPPMSGSSGGMGATYNITVNVGMGSGNGTEIGREIVAAIRRYERTSGRVFASA